MWNIMKENDYNLCCLGCFLILFVVGIFVFMTAYIVFAIIGLIGTSFNKEHELCNESHLWIYTLISLVLIGFAIKNTSYLMKMREIEKEREIEFLINTDKETNKRSYSKILFNFLISLGMFIWGAYEFFTIKCISNLNNTMLYKSAFAYWIFITIQSSLISIVFVAGLLKIKLLFNDTLKNNSFEKDELLEENILPHNKN